MKLTNYVDNFRLCAEQLQFLQFRHTFLRIQNQHLSVVSVYSVTHTVYIIADTLPTK